MGRLTIVGLVGAVLLAAEPASAQFVRVGPGGGVSVRAPFVHVEVGPGGSTYVRAPFTSVNTPGFRGLAPRYDGYAHNPNRYGPVTSNSYSGATTRLRPLTANEFAAGGSVSPAAAVTEPAQMNWRQLRRYTRDVAARLETELKQTTDGSAWTPSLRPGTIRDLLADDVNGPPDANTVEQLLEILRSYDALVESRGYPQIERLSAFQEMRKALGELVLPPRERMRRGLIALWAGFRDDLGQFATGATWQEFLQLPHAIVEGSSGTQQQLRQVEELLSRYRQVEGREEYRAVAQLTSFQITRQALTDYAELLKQELSTPGGEAPQVETIPPPQPLQ